MKNFATDILFTGRIGRMDLFNRGMLLLFVLAFTLLAPRAAEAYPVMDNDRMLMMNNDSKWGSSITYQGYNDTDPGKKTYWVHDTTSPGFTPALLKGVNHTMFKSDGTRLWELVNCRAGSATVVNSTSRNYIPWTTTAKSILDETTKIPVDSTGAKAVGSVIFRNSNTSCVYSPFYQEGIGTIYFDAVNAFVNVTDGLLALEIATNVTEEAVSQGTSMESVTDVVSNEGLLDWQPYPFDLFEVANKTTVTLTHRGVTNATMASSASGDKLFYRVRCQLNYYGPIRFRIRRQNQTGGNADTTGLILLDNLIASYPPMTYELHRSGEDYDPDLKGAEVLGCTGDFDSLFLSRGSALCPRASFGIVTNSATTAALVLQNPRMIWRWRYLNQSMSEWHEIPFDQKTITSANFDSTNLTCKIGVPFNGGVGDVEYFFVAEQDAPSYSFKDYALGSVNYGDNWTEAITSVTNRASYTELDALPSNGTDYFVRIREGESDYEWVKLVALTSTNGVDGATGEDLKFGKTTETRMELVGDHTWRLHYYVPTNAIGETLSFHFQGKEYFKTNETDLAYSVRTNTWYSDLSDGLPYIPFTSVAKSEFTLDARTRLDGASTHLLIEFNDELRSFSVSHAAYQNFNMWTDAVDGFRGNATYDDENPTNGTYASGVSDTKRSYDAAMSDWETASFYDDFWRESFSYIDIKDTTYAYDVHRVVAETPNGWTVENGAFVSGRRGVEYDDMGEIQKSLAWQMDGHGKGTMSLTKKAVPGVGEVSFSARVSQMPAFENFATYLDGTREQSYAISAQLTMSRLLDPDKKKCPLDISPTHPSVSLVGYYRASKGCYELRFMRVDDQHLAAELYKWTQDAGEMTARLLTSNLLYTVGNSTAGPGPNGTKQETIGAFNNLLVPEADADRNTNWTSAMLSLFTHPDGTVSIDGWISPQRNNKRLDQDNTNLKNVIHWVDAAPGPLTRGTYGIGSCDCQAAFGQLQRHVFSGNMYGAKGDKYGVLLQGTDLSLYDAFEEDWDLMENRWRTLTSTETAQWKVGFSALIPDDQTIELYVAESKGAGNETWVPSGCSATVASFATNTIVFKVHSTENSLVQLRTGAGDASVTVDDVVVSSWTAPDRDAADYHHSDEWYFNHAVIETTAEIRGGQVEVRPAGTNGYVYVFKSTNVPIDFTPLTDMVIDRVLMVGGGGSGGATMGGGGGGGGVVEYDWSTNATQVTLAAGETVRVIVGAGGKAVRPTAGGGGHAGQPGGQKGGDTSVVGIPGMAVTKANGGGGGGGWGEAGLGSAPFGSAGGKSGNGNAASGNGGFTATQGYAGGNGVNSNSPNGSQGGGGGGAGGAGASAVKPASGSPYGGKGGDGKVSDITGEELYYGGGGGGGAAWHSTAKGGAGGLQGDGYSDAGHGADYQYKNGYSATKGLDGFGGGGGGGTYIGNGTVDQSILGMGADGGSGTVIIRVRTSAKVCTLQPARGVIAGATADYEGEVEPVGLRSPFLANGLSLVSFDYADANSNAVLWLQVNTNCTHYSFVPGQTIRSPELPQDQTDWETRCVWVFPGRAKGVTPTPSGLRDGVVTNLVPASELKGGTLSFYQSLRAPISGIMRLVVAPEVVREAAARARTEPDYGKLTITRAYCYDEPLLDDRSWYGWNFHTEGWNTRDKSYAYLVDSPNGLSGMLNFSALQADNDGVEALGIGLGEKNLAEYAKNNPFVQSPSITNGVGKVSFRARAFTNNQACSSWITLYGSRDPQYQVQNPHLWLTPEEKPLAVFQITNTTFQTFTWETTDDNEPPYVIRLEVNGARKGRYGVGADDWEKPQETPIQRVLVDEISVSEPIVPRLVFRDVRPFRSRQLREDAHIAVSNVTSASEQPITGESWGIQATVEPQQMGDELDTDSLRVFASVHIGEIPWGYRQWAGLERVVELPRMGSNLVFRSHMDRPESIQAPLSAYSTVQYMVWAEFRDRAGVIHTNMLDSAQWNPPSWYYGLENLNVRYGAGLPDRFSGYSIFDSISPKRAWVNEVNLQSTTSDENQDKRNQYVEFAVPQNADLTGWYLQVTCSQVFSNQVMATFGRGNAMKTIKNGTRPGVDSTNCYTFMTLHGPLVTNAAVKAASDGIWNSVKNDPGHIDDNGALRPYEPYGVALIRPSGVIEHEVIVEGRNMWENSDLGDMSFLEGLYSGTNMLAQILEREPGSAWFFAGRDQDKGTLGVFRSHGENGGCWTNRMMLTPGELNRLEDGTRQSIDPDWFLRPNGTNVWIYANVNSAHIVQDIAGVTNRDVAVMVIGKGDSTNILYKVDRWYEIGTLTTNGENGVAVEVAGARGRGGARDTPPHQYTLRLDNVQESITVNVGDQASQVVVDAGLSRDDPYFPAVMHWLSEKFADSDDDQIWPIEYLPIAGTLAKPVFLGIKDAYWLDIPPTEKGWVIRAGMGGAGSGKPGVDNRVCMPKGYVYTNWVNGVAQEIPATNIVVTLTMMISNRVTNVARKPTYLQGLEPGSTSLDYAGEKGNNWTSCTFKITGALQKPGVSTNYYPLRWFVFGPDSFDDNFQAKIEITDPFLQQSTGGNYGWPEFRNTYEIWYRWRLDGNGSGTASTEPLKADSTY